MAALLVGLGLSSSAAADADPVADALAAERLGFDFVSASDHPCGTHPTYETWTMLTWIAAATTHIRIATRVLGVPYRPPAMVAKAAESLARLSGGRLVLGLGGGHSDEEFRAFGLDVPTAAEKVAGLADAARILRGLWAGPEVTYAGPRYRVEAATIEPRPAHRIPIWMGTFGPRALRVTGELADGWIPSLGYVSDDDLPAMRGRVRAAASAVGRDPDTIACVLNATVRLGDGSAADPSTVTGTAAEIGDRLAGYAQMGFTGFNLGVTGPAPAEQVERLAAEVVPLLRRL